LRHRAAARSKSFWQRLETNPSDPHQNDQGAGFKEWVDSARQTFSIARFAKPDAIRADGSEPYLLASSFRMV
jgi:hypothetical protein